MTTGTTEMLGNVTNVEFVVNMCIMVSILDIVGPIGMNCMMWSVEKYVMSLVHAWCATVDRRVWPAIKINLDYRLISAFRVVTAGPT